MYRVNVYQENSNERDIVARVKYNTNLDYWDGRNFVNGGAGRHKGITKLKDGSFVIIHGTDWQGETDSAYIVSDREALEAIMESDSFELLEKGRFKKLREMYDELDNMEDDDDED